MMIDAIDRQIIDVLRREPRTSNKSIAAALELSETTIGVRLERLSNNDIARVIVQQDVRALGWHVSGMIEVSARGQDMEALVERLHRIPNVITIFVMAGAPALLVKIAASDIDEITQIAVERVGSDPVVERLELQVCLSHSRMRAGFGNLESPRRGAPQGDGDLQAHIVDILARDGRISNREIARTLDTAEATVRKRIRSMLGKGLLRYILVCNPDKVGYNALAFINLEVPPDRLYALAEQVSSHPNVFGVTVLTGRHNLHISIYGSDWPELWRICATVAKIDESIRDAVIRPVSAFARHRYELAFIQNGQA